jgi:hypothetical protein
MRDSFDRLRNTLRAIRDLAKAHETNSAEGQVLSDIQDMIHEALW